MGKACLRLNHSSLLLEVYSPMFMIIQSTTLSVRPSSSHTLPSLLTTQFTAACYLSEIPSHGAELIRPDTLLSPIEIMASNYVCGRDYLYHMCIVSLN
jgi:hypothetical protein